MKLDQIINQPLIEGARFDLRPLRKSDQGLIELYAGDLRVAQMTGTIPHPYPPGAAEAYVARAVAVDRSHDVWALDASRLGGAELMGVIGLDRQEEGQADLGYWLAPQFWGQGFATEAVDALISANPTKTQLFTACVFQGNPASARVLTNCGFSYLGDCEGFCVARDTQLPTWTYSRKAH